MPAQRMKPAGVLPLRSFGMHDKSSTSSEDSSTVDSSSSATAAWPALTWDQVLNKLPSLGGSSCTWSLSKGSPSERNPPS